MSRASESDSSTNSWASDFFVSSPTGFREVFKAFESASSANSCASDLVALNSSILSSIALIFASIPSICDLSAFAASALLSSRALWCSFRSAVISASRLSRVFAISSSIARPAAVWHSSIPLITYSRVSCGVNIPPFSATSMIPSAETRLSSNLISAAPASRNPFQYSFPITSSLSRSFATVTSSTRPHLEVAKTTLFSMLS